MTFSRRTLIKASAASAVLGSIGAPLQALSQAIGPSTSFRSYNYNRRYIRHRNFQVELAEVSYTSGERDRLDATFLIRSAFGSTYGVMFEARNENLRGYFLRHKDFRLVMGKMPPPGSPDRERFINDATWNWAPGLADRSDDRRYRSYFSANFRDRFIRHRGFQLFLDRIDTSKPLDQADATFQIENPGLKPA
ncbi:AbfB domain-containing protein [Bradyrhizobium sp.]|uniref:AbfB domain-containing protein n=1 Tax=Bradyrhizobium sp. TaxID=376 RepID=UPI002736C820|nr:AbfB domain-containing protein [Bradyrhizobium sp.]MDP3689559.1 AbfB domain-containing protein [Bradyrhizobium sp.]